MKRSSRNAHSFFGEEFQSDALYWSNIMQNRNFHAGIVENVITLGVAPKGKCVLVEICQKYITIWIEIQKTKNRTNKNHLCENMKENLQPEMKISYEWILVDFCWYVIKYTWYYNKPLRNLFLQFFQGQTITAPV